MSASAAAEPAGTRGAGAASAGDVLALGDQARTRADLGADAASVARRLRAVGARSVLLACQDRYHVAVGLLGAWGAGAIALLPPSARPAAVHALAEQQRADLIIADDAESGVDIRSLLDARPRGGDDHDHDDDGRLARVDARALPRDARHLVTVFTSGSTGPSTAWPKTAAQLLGEADLLAGLFGFGAGTRVLASAPPHHLYGLLFGVLAPLVGGGAFVRGVSPLPADIAAQAQRYAATVLCAVPAHYAGLASLSGADLPRVERAFSSGGRLDLATRERLSVRFPFTLTEIFGSSETGGVAYRDAGIAEAGWRPLPGVEVSAAEDGRLLVDSPFVSPGESPGSPRGFLCADRIELHADGTFRHQGRADEVLKVGGERVSLVEVEAKLRAVPGVRDVAITGVFVDGPRQWELWAAVVAPGQDVESLRRALRTTVDPVALPRRFALVQAIPREGSGKIRREALLACFG